MTRVESNQTMPLHTEQLEHGEEVLRSRQEDGPVLGELP
jgi:hypothetical protein